MVGGALVEAVAGAGDSDDVGAVEESVEDGAGCGDVAEELAPFFDGAVGGHDGLRGQALILDISARVKSQFCVL